MGNFAHQLSRSQRPLADTGNHRRFDIEWPVEPLFDRWPKSSVKRARFAES